MFWLTHPFSVSFMGLIAWMNTVYPVNFVQNILTTGLIAFKILFQHRVSTAAGARRAGSRLRLIHVVRILIESAMMYTVQLLALMVLYFRVHNAQFVVQYAIVPTIGARLSRYTAPMLKAQQELFSTSLLYAFTWLRRRAHKQRGPIS